MQNVPAEEMPPGDYVCRMCKKTFYNQIALMNHALFNHDGATDDILNSPGIRSFHFVPYLKMNGDLFYCQNNSSVFDEDTSYIIMEAEGDGHDADSMKRRRLEGVTKNLTKERKTIDLRGPFTCTAADCTRTFNNCCEYSLHFRDQHTKRRKAALRCQICENRLDRDFTCDVTTNTFSCRFCEITFYDSCEYDDHNRISHAKDKPYQCSICSKRFTQQGGLQQHIRMHAGIRPFSCTFCTKSFTQKAGLDQHLRTHTKVKPFICIVCRKGFSQSVHLRQHMRTHTNIQPFECPVCKRRFKQSSHLNFHMRTHPNEYKSWEKKKNEKGDVIDLTEDMRSNTRWPSIMEGGITVLNLEAIRSDQKNSFVKLTDVIRKQNESDTMYYSASVATPQLNIPHTDYSYHQKLLAETVSYL